MGNPSVAGIAPPPWAVRSIATVGGREVAPPKSHQPACPRRQVIETQPGEANTPRRMICMSACLHARTQPAQPTPGQTVGRADDPYGAAQPPPLRQPKYQDGNPPGGPARPDRTRLGPTEHGAAQPAARQPTHDSPAVPTTGVADQSRTARPNRTWNGRSVRVAVPTADPATHTAGVTDQSRTESPTTTWPGPTPNAEWPGASRPGPTTTWPGPAHTWPAPTTTRPGPTGHGQARAQTRGREHNARPETQAGLPGGGTGPPAHQTDNPGPFTSPGRLRGQANPTRPAIRTGA